MVDVACAPHLAHRLLVLGLSYAFLVLKKIFGFTKVRYRGIAKNLERLQVACALVNLYQLRRVLLRAAAVTLPRIHIHQYFII